MGVNWPTILVGSVLTTLLTLAGQLFMQRRQHRLAQEMVEWTTRRERADRIERAVSRVYIASLFLLAEYDRNKEKPHNIETQLLELRQALDDAGNLAAHPNLTQSLVELWAKVSNVLTDMKASKQLDTNSEVWEQYFWAYLDVVEQLKLYRAGKEYRFGKP